MTLQDFIQGLKDQLRWAKDHLGIFLTTNWKEILGAIGAIGGVILWVIEKLGKVPSAYWLILALLFWLFILLSAAFSVKTARPILRAFTIVVLIAGVFSVGYFGVVSAIYFITDEPTLNGEIFDKASNAVELTGSGNTDIAYKEDFDLAFAKSADYTETDFTFAKHEVQQLLLTYDDLPQYKDKVKRSDTRIAIERVTPDLKLHVVLVAKLTQPMQDPAIKVNVETTFSERNRWWRLKRWIFERYQE